MTTLLSAFTPDSLNSRLNKTQRLLPKSTDHLFRVSKPLGGSLKDHPPTRQFSPISQKSVVSAPTICNDENATPFVRPGYLPLNSIFKANLNDQSIVDKHTRSDRKWPLFVRSKISSDNQSRESSQPFSTNQSQNLIKTFQLRKAQFQNDTPTTAKQRGCTLKIAGAKDESPSESERAALIAEDASEPFPTLDIGETSEISRNKALCNRQSDSSASRDNSYDDASSITPHIRNKHRQRPSDASSAFVHSMKTASMSNVSFSMVSRSVRLGRSSESYGYIRGYSRHSLDSDRPAVEPVPDDQTSRRGVKRKQIIEELIVTEEGYVSDLKNLSSLYSTMLVPVISSSSPLHLAVQQNITEMLHNHEILVQKLRKTISIAAARKWRGNSVRANLEPANRACVKIDTDHSNHTTDKGQFRIRSTIDTSDIAQVSHALSTADPSEVLEIVQVFSGMMKGFDVYEEYCANHETVAVELQKLLTEKWSSYGAGIESLSRALTPLDQRQYQQGRGLTVSDLLIKPVQRICRYPLILSDLLKHTPAMDSPDVNKAVENLLTQFQVIAQTINQAIGNHATRFQLQRKWLLRNRLILHENTISQDQYRSLGTVQLCGVLYLTYQTDGWEVCGMYVACILFDNHLLIAIPTIKPVKLDPFALISLEDADLASSKESIGLQAVSSLHTWKLKFTAEGNRHEVLLSACSSTEEELWIEGLKGKYRPDGPLEISTLFDPSRIFRKLKVSNPRHFSLTPQLQHSPRRAIEVELNHENSCKVVLRNTYNPQDLQEFRSATPPIAARSQNQQDGPKPVVFTPKRVERTRLETALSEVYTKDRLPFPGIIGSASSRIIRASAGSLARKLSFASMQATFSKRSTSLSSKKSYHTIQTVPAEQFTFCVKNPEREDQTTIRPDKIEPLSVSDFDSMDTLIGRMIGNGVSRKRLSFTRGEKLVRKQTKKSRARRNSACPVGPEDPASIFYGKQDSYDIAEKEPEEAETDELEKIGENMVRGKKKRWSNPISKLRGLGSDGFKGILSSTG